MPCFTTLIQKIKPYFKYYFVKKKKLHIKVTKNDCSTKSSTAPAHLAFLKLYICQHVKVRLPTFTLINIQQISTLTDVFNSALQLSRIPLLTF